jgi:hypothetical protein
VKLLKKLRRKEKKSDIRRQKAGCHVLHPKRKSVLDVSVYIKRRSRDREMSLFFSIIPWLFTMNKMIIPYVAVTRLSSTSTSSTGREDRVHKVAYLHKPWSAVTLQLNLFLA